MNDGPLIAGLVGLAVLAAWFVPGYLQEQSVDLLARTMWGEARGEGEIGMQAVAAVVVNRLNSPNWPNTIEGVVLQPYQFSVWNGGVAADQARAVDASDPQFAQALRIAAEVVQGRRTDPTFGATHYYAYELISAPSWAAGLAHTADIGRHRFYA